jgi:hypothetical protein
LLWAIVDVVKKSVDKLIAFKNVIIPPKVKTNVISNRLLKKPTKTTAIP